VNRDLSYILGRGLGWACVSCTLLGLLLDCPRLGAIAWVYAWGYFLP
jgi:hypothetical protein